MFDWVLNTPLPVKVGLILATDCVRAPHAMYFLSYKMPYFLLKPFQIAIMPCQWSFLLFLSYAARMPLFSNINPGRCRCSCRKKVYVKQFNFVKFSGRYSFSFLFNNSESVSSIDLEKFSINALLISTFQ